MLPHLKRVIVALSFCLGLSFLGCRTEDLSAKSPFNSTPSDEMSGEVNDPELHSGNTEGEPGEIGQDPDDGEDEGEIGGWITENFVQNQFTEFYDFLWVVDNSGSMSNIHSFMSQNLTNFVSVLESRRSLDWQMAVTITDHVDFGGNLVSGNGGIRVVSGNSQDPATEWASIIGNIQGTPHSGWEQGLESGRSAIELHGSEFNRNQVPLIVVYISDEEDYSCESQCNNFNGLPENQTGWNAFPVTRYANHFASLKTQIEADVIVYPIVHLNPLGQPGSCDDDYGFVGQRYIDVQQSVGTGTSLSICQQHLSASFDQVAQLTANRGVCFTLAQTVADPSTISVSVDGTSVQASSEDGYTYESQNNSICFNGNTIPENGANVEVTYQAL